MKKIVTLVLACLAMFYSVNLSAQSTAPIPAQPTYPNGVQTAVAFLSAGQFFALHCAYNVEVEVFGQTTSGAEGEFVLFLADMKIHYFTSGGRVIVGLDEEPLDGFPFYSASKVRNLNIWVQSAEGNDSQRPVYGYYGASNVSCASPIVLTLYPQSRQWMVGFDSDNLNIALRFTNGGGLFDYDADLHAFKV